MTRSDEIRLVGAVTAWAEKHPTPDLAVQACGHKVVSLSGSAVTPAAVRGALGMHDACFYFGHGTWSTLQEASGLTLLDVTTSSASSGRSIVAVACQAAHTLGPSIVAAHS